MLLLKRVEGGYLSMRKTLASATVSASIARFRNKECELMSVLNQLRGDCTNN